MPNTDIYILHDIPIHADYKHTLWFEQPETQINYFLNTDPKATKIKYKLDKNSYQRVERNYIRVGIKSDLLYGCNYIVYRNTAFGNKWFFAFITSIEYINNNVSELKIELDAMQTFLFDYEMRDCFVEREHSQTDIVGENLLPEHVELGEYVSLRQDVTGLFDDWVIVLALNSETLLDSGLVPYPVEGVCYGRTYHQTRFYTYELNAAGMQALYNKIFGLNLFGNVDIISNIFMCPREMTYSGVEKYETVPVKQVEFSYKKYNATDINSDRYPYNFQIKNNKLLTYPYNFLSVSNGQGIEKEYKYELFDENGLPNDKKGKCNFFVVTDSSIDPKTCMLPRKYKLEQEGENFVVDERITIGDFPRCTYASNDFLAKLTQSVISIGIMAATGVPIVPSLPTNTTTKSNFQSVESGIVAQKGKNAGDGGTKETGVEDSEYDNYSEARKNNHQKEVLSAIAGGVFGNGAHPSFGDGNTLYNASVFDFIICPKHIRNEYAKIIDEYFTMYGYQTNRVKQPNRSGRKQFNYVQTKNSIIVAKRGYSIPEKYEKIICGVYDSGVTFWKDPQKVGDYSVDNKPLD